MIRLIAFFSMAGSLMLGAPPAVVAAGLPAAVGGRSAGESGQKPYSVIKPADWNGSFVLDLDLNRRPAAPQNAVAANAGLKDIVSNERVLVRDVTWTTGAPRPQSHADETITVFLQGGTLKVTRPGGTSSTIAHKSGDVMVDAKGAGDTREAVGSAVRAVVVDLHDKAVPPLPNRSGLPEAFPRPGSKRILENARVAVWDYTFVPGEASPMHFHSRDVVTIYTEDGAVTSTTPQGDTTVNEHFPGEIKFNPRNRTHTERVTRGKVHIIVVELK